MEVELKPRYHASGYGASNLRSKASLQRGKRKVFVMTRLRQDYSGQVSGRGVKKVFIMLSGGVDSSVAAALLKKRGFDVTGVFMKNWGDERGGACQWIEDERDARRVAAMLHIPFYVINFEKEYYELVFVPFLEGIKRGNTPNPDVFCNEHIKFGVFLDRALKLGADMVATGHYARVKLVKNYSLQTTHYKLQKAKDKNKDQTYFLYRLNQFQLSKTLFPIGEYEKSEVRAMAKELGLPTFQKPDSQGICFVGEEPFEEFLSRYIPSRDGAILDAKGKEIGRHRGAAFYTIGQRKGLGVGGLNKPLFVAEKNVKANTLVVVPEGNSLLYVGEVPLSQIHWISEKEPNLPLLCETRIRYRQPLQPCFIEQINVDTYADKRRKNLRKSASLSVIIRIRFSERQRAITPGQSVVFYKNREVLGGGIIE